MPTKPNTTQGGRADTQVRLVIGRDQMGGFDGLSDGDRFGHVDHKGVFVVRNHTKYGITLRPNGDPFQNALPGFCNLPDYMSFVRAVNQEWSARN